MTTPIKPPTDNFPRGGGWYNRGAAWFRAAYRVDLTSAYRDNILGFRCAQRGVRQVLKVTP